MNLFDWIFKKRKQKKPPKPIPSWKTVIEIMHNKHLDTFADEVVKVIYSKDNSMRYVILKNKKGFFTYQLEAIYQFDKEEWKYISSQDNTLSAMWEPFRGIVGKSIFDNIEELLKEMKAEPEYKQYFQ